MSLSPLLLLLLACGSQASHFYGVVMTFNPKQHQNGTVTVVFRYKTGFSLCSQSNTWRCHSGDCGTQTSLVLGTVEQSSGEWCQREGTMTRLISTFNSTRQFELRLNSCCWIHNIRNGIVHWRALTQVDLRIRSDTGQANRSPQTTILPLLRVPSNCQRDFNLLAFDPDGDQVKCRFGSGSEECNPCTIPSVLTIQSNCTLSFSGTNSSNEGLYVVQLMVEDFPTQSIYLNSMNNSTLRTTNNALSKLPVQFVVKVDPAVPSCAAGQFLPRFLSPTPANGAQLYTYVNQALEITVNTEATSSTVSELLVSGPHNITKQNGLASGQFILRWTPSEAEDGEHHPICFVAQAVLSSSKYHSEMRCVIVSVTNAGYILGLQAKLSSAVPLTEDDTRNIIQQQLKEELVRRGLQEDFTLQLRGVRPT